MRKAPILALAAALFFTSAALSAGAASGNASASTQSLAAPTWIELAPTGGPPTARGFHGTTAVLDPSTNRMIVFAGRSASGNTNDVWVLTNANGAGGMPQWTNLIPNGVGGSPPPRSGHSAVYDPTTNRMIIFAGCGGGCLPTRNDVWVLTNANGIGGTPSWIQISPTGAPPGRVRHTAVYDPTTNRMIVFGGQNGSGSGGATYPEVWVLSNANGQGGTSAWIKLAPTGGPPPGQYAPSAVYDPATNRMTVFGGGAQGTGFPTNAVWLLSNANGLGGPAEWTNPIAEGAGGSPPARAYHSAIRDTASNQMTIFGSGPTGNDVWVLTNANGLGGNSSAWMELAPTGGPPAARCCHSAVYDQATNRMTIFAGSRSESPYPYLNDTWVLKLNEPPVSDPNGPYLGAMDVTINFDGTASSDPDGDPLSYDWNWGDTTASPDAGATPTHAYDAAGIYDVCLTVTDPYGKSDTACTIAVVYDPEGGFVTGGGWISSDPGAYVADPLLEGTATFGFVSKYKKGADTPTGNTEFQFQSADLNFHSDTYEWLVVAQGGTNAHFKGTGTINGTGEYKFMLWAGDNDPDTFRIRIWTEDEADVETDIYDNGFDQALGGGSVIVHTKKK